MTQNQHAERIVVDGREVYVIGTVSTYWIARGDGRYLNHAGTWDGIDELDDGNEWPTREAAIAIARQHADQSPAPVEQGEPCPECGGTGGYLPAYVSAGEIVGPDACHACDGTGVAPPPQAAKSDPVEELYDHLFLTPNDAAELTALDAPDQPTTRGKRLPERLAQPQPAGSELPNLWKVAEQWYDESSIIESVKRSSDGAFGERQRIPADVTSEEFGKWLTHEYRLAMHKGLDMAVRGNWHEAPASSARLMALEAEVVRLKAEMQWRAEPDYPNWGEVEIKNTSVTAPDELRDAAHRLIQHGETLGGCGSPYGKHTGYASQFDEIAVGNAYLSIEQQLAAAIAERDAAAAILPLSYYADRPLAERIGFMVGQWQRAVEAIHTVEAARDAALDQVAWRTRDADKAAEILSNSMETSVRLVQERDAVRLRCEQAEAREVVLNKQTVDLSERVGFLEGTLIGVKSQVGDELREKIDAALSDSPPPILAELSSLRDQLTAARTALGKIHPGGVGTLAECIEDVGRRLDELAKLRERMNRIAELAGQSADKTALLALMQEIRRLATEASSPRPVRD